MLSNTVGYAGMALGALFMLVGAWGIWRSRREQE